MIEKKTLVTALSGVLVGGLLLSGGMTFASSAKSSEANNQTGKMPFLGEKGHRGGMAPGRGGMELGRGDFGTGGPKLSQESLDQLVKEDAITQEKANEIKAYLDKMEKEMQTRSAEMKKLTPEERKALAVKKKTESTGTTNPGLRPFGKSDLFAELVTNNILTQEQADTLKTKIHELAHKQKQQQMSDSLKALVEKKTITQEQADKILKGFEDAEKDREALLKKMETMTMEERRQYMQENKGKPQNPIAQLVADKVITQDQAKAIGKIIPFRAGPQRGRH